MPAALLLLLALQTPKNSNNPIFGGWYADPEAHVYGSRDYVYPNYSASYEKQTFMGVGARPIRGRG